MRNLIFLVSVFMIMLIYSGCGEVIKKGDDLSSYGARKDISQEEILKNLEVQNHYKEQIQNAYTEEQLYDVAKNLRRDKRVGQVFVHPKSGRIDIIYKNGMLGGIGKSLKNRNIKSFSNMTTKLYTNSVPLELKHSRALNNIVVQNKKVLSLALQYWDWGESDDVPQITKMLENDGGFEVVKSYQSELEGNLDLFTSLDRYGVVLLSSHGDSFGRDGHEIVIIHTNTKRSAYFDDKYAQDRSDGSLIYFTIGDDVVYFVTPKFIAKHNKNFDNTLVYMSICKGAYNTTMADAFIKNGAGVYLGYSDYVGVYFTRETGVEFFSNMLSLDKDLTYNNISQSFKNGIKEYDQDPAEFKKFLGSDLVAIKNTPNISSTYQWQEDYYSNTHNSVYPYDTTTSYNDGELDASLFDGTVNDDFSGDTYISDNEYLYDGLYDPNYDTYEDSVSTYADDNPYDVYGIMANSGDTQTVVGEEYDGHINISLASDDSTGGGEYYNSVCASCHGYYGEQRANGVSDYINYFSTQTARERLYAYKYYNENRHGSGFVMSDILQDVSDELIEKLAVYIGSM